MYQFETTVQRDAYRSALASGAAQHLNAVIKDKDGSELHNYTIVDTPSIDSRCIEDEEVYNIGGMYVGELDLRIQNSTMRSAVLIGGEVQLTFSVDIDGSDPIEVPLGVWDIVDAKRESYDFIKIKGNDHMGRLVAPIGITEVMQYQMSTILEVVETNAGVTFAQTPEQIIAMAVKDEISIAGGHDPKFNVYGTCTHFEATCWDEVRVIAQLIGGFAFANRDGEIEFRRFQYPPTLDIQADKRFHVEISEQWFCVKGATYIRDNGQSYTKLNTTNPESSSIICIPENKYIWLVAKNTEGYERIAESYASYLAISAARVYPGTVEFYGDPSLDLGDMVTLSGGIGSRYDDEHPVCFLVQCNYWQFRGSQTISCGGAPAVGQFAASSSSSSSSGAVPTPASSGSKITVSDFAQYSGYVFPTARTIARSRIGCTSDTDVFIEANFVFLGSESCTLHTDIYIDDAKERFAPKAQLSDDEYTTISFSIHKQLESGVHSIAITAAGASELMSISSYAWGHDIKSEELEYSSDFTYVIIEGKATIREYIGDSLYVETPEKLGGAPVDVIGNAAFAYSDVTAVYIPEGVTRIE